MSDLYSEIRRDEERYVSLCKKYNETPKFKKNRWGESIYDIYGKHAEKLNIMETNHE